jgi:protein-tyrosine kinase
MSRSFELLQKIERERCKDPGTRADTIPCPIRNMLEGPLVPCRRATDALSQTGREQLLNMVHRLFLMEPFGAPRNVVFSSCETNDSATNVAAWAGEILAEHSRSGNVCIIDGNPRMAALHERFGLKNGRGLSNTLLDGGFPRDTLQRVAANLWFMRSGTLQVPAAERAYADHQVLQSRMAELAAEFNYVLVGAANVALYPEALMLARVADGVVLVVEADITRWQAVEACKQSLQQAGAVLLGAVLNRKPLLISSRRQTVC